MPSVVGLYTLNEVLGFLSKSLDPKSLPLECLGRLNDWELDPVVARGRVCLSIPNGQSIGEMVQRTSEIVSTITSYQRQSIKRCRPSNPYNQAVPARCRVVLFNKLNRAHYHAMRPILP